MEIKVYQGGEEPDWRWLEEADIPDLMAQVRLGHQLQVKYENSGDIWYETYYLKPGGSGYLYSKIQGCFDYETPVDHASDVHNQAVTDLEVTKMMESWARQGLNFALFDWRK